MSWLELAEVTILKSLGSIGWPASLEWSEILDFETHERGLAVKATQWNTLRPRQSIIVSGLLQ